MKKLALSLITLCAPMFCAEDIETFKQRNAKVIELLCTKTDKEASETITKLSFQIVEQSIQVEEMFDQAETNPETHKQRRLICLQLNWARESLFDICRKIVCQGGADNLYDISGQFSDRNGRKIVQTRTRSKV